MEIDRELAIAGGPRRRVTLGVERGSTGKVAPAPEAEPADGGLGSSAGERDLPIRRPVRDDGGGGRDEKARG
jgi:hypothetical protein